MCPPCPKCLVRSNEESLLWRWSFGEGIGDIGAKDDEVLGGGDSVEDTRAGLVDAVGVGMIENPCLSTPR